MNTVYIKPAPGRLTRHPETGEILPQEGMSVPRNSYWLRRLKDGDVVEAVMPKAVKTLKSKED